MRLHVVVVIGWTCLALGCGSGPRLHEREADPPTASRGSVGDQPEPTSSDDASAAAATPHRTLVVAPTAGLGPDWLAFPRGGDGVVARVGGESLSKSQVYDYLVQTFPDKVRAAVAVLLSNRVLAAEVERHGIRVPEGEVDAFFARHKKELEQRARYERGLEADLDGWLRQAYGQSFVEYERVARDRERARLLLSRVVRYHAMREDRVTFRLISLTDANQARQVRTMLDEGAEFATLAKQFSVHPSAEQGGLMPAIWRLALNPDLEKAVFGLDVGGTSSIVEARDANGRARFQIVRVTAREAGRDVPYSEVEDEVAAGLIARPMTEDEWYMWQLKLERESVLSIGDGMNVPPAD